MALDQKQVEDLKVYYPTLNLIEDGGVEFIFISPLQLPTGCNPAVVDALLCPCQRDGYTSRLFVSAKIVHAGPGQNWNADGVLIAGRKWWAVSWNTNKTGLSLLEMLLTHLEAFK